MTFLQPETNRRPRFTREVPTPMRLTHDDFAILHHIAKHRFLRSTHLVRLMSERSPKKLIERLGKLFHNGYVDRPRAQLDYYSNSGSAPLVYALGSRGAFALAVETEDRMPDWNFKNRSVGKVFVEHALLTADMMIAAECAAREHPNVRLIEPHEFIAQGSQSRFDGLSPIKLKTSIMSRGQRIEVAVIPDKIFGLDFAKHTRKYFFVEADRATMPIIRTDLDQSSYYRKLLAYVAGGGTSNLFGRQLGIENFRVLTVTTSTERTASMLAALRHATDGKGSNQFLFVDRATLISGSDLFGIEFVAGKGDRVRLCD